jgi:tetratricopeptide (TPR) repeat protein
MMFTLVALEGAWRHAPGDPVEFHHGNASSRHEEGNLSARHADAYRRWAAAYEQIYEVLEGRYPAQRREQLRGGVAGYWYRAGKQLEALGKADEAQRCFARALGWRPTMLRAWGRRKFGEEAA